MAWQDGVFGDVLRALWLFLPAYVANMSPVFSAKLVPRWNHPIDGGRLHRDGQRVLGAGKTWRGLVFAGVAGALTAVGMALAAPPQVGGPYGNPFTGWDFGYRGYIGDGVGFRQCIDSGCAGPATPLWRVALFGGLVGFFALVGDAVKSYFKRRRGKEGGAPWVPFDQLDFVAFGLLAMLAAAPLLPGDWVVAALTHSWAILATLLVLTPFLHYGVNLLGYVLRLKKVPW